MCDLKNVEILYPLQGFFFRPARTGEKVKKNVLNKKTLLSPQSAIEKNHSPFYAPVSLCVYVFIIFLLNVAPDEKNQKKILPALAVSNSFN